MRRMMMVATVAVLLVVWAEPAGAVTVRPLECGTVTGRVVLAADLVCGEIHIGARATVDLGGHRLTGGVVTVERATVRNGMLACADGSLSVSGSRFVGAGVVGLRCSMSISGNRMAADGFTRAVDVIESADRPVVIDGNEIAGYSVGVDSTRTVNGPQALDFTLADNRIHDGQVGAQLSCGGLCTVDGNRLSSNSFYGLTAGGYSGSTITVTDNRAVGNDFGGLLISGPTIVEAGNRARGNGPPQCLGVVCTR